MPVFFPTPTDLRAWFEANHATETELIVGYYKKATKIPSVDWPQSVDEALCFGWIDGIRRRIDEKSYSIRFTPRKARSHWSAVNLAKMEKLLAEKRVAEAGLIAYERRDPENSEQFAYEQKTVALAPEYEAELKAEEAAWTFFYKKLAPSFRKATIHWVMSAKREATRRRRLRILIESSLAEQKVPQFRR